MKKVTIVGVGALGSNVAMLLRSENVTLRLVDHDRVETKNLGSQFHGVTSVGQNKAVSLQRTLALLWRTSTTPFPTKMTQENSAILLGESDLILDCLDNGESRRVLKDYAESRGIPCLHGALAANGECGRVVWDELFSVDDEPSEGAATCRSGEFLPFISLVASFMAVSAQKFLRSSERPSYHVFSSGRVVLI